MNHPDLVPEALVKAAYILIGQRDFRNQQDHLFSLGHHLFHHRHIDFRFAAAGNAMKQYGPVFPSQFLFYALHSLSLGLI